MFFSSLLRNLQRYARRNRCIPPQRSIRRPRYVPRLEALEDRLVLSTLMVTSAADDGSSGTLRSVLSSAQSGDTIRFAHDLQGQTITLTQGQLTIGQNLTIEGLGASQLAISGNASSRVLAIDSGTTVTITGLTITDGLATDGAGILNQGDLTLKQDDVVGNVAQGVGSAVGGGIENRRGATLEVDQSVISDNQALGGSGGSDGSGGGIYSIGLSVVVIDSTLNGNQAIGGATSDQLRLGGFGDGGALSLQDSGTDILRGTALSNNLALGGTNSIGTGGDGSGGAVHAGSSLQMSQCTVTGNEAIGGATQSGNRSGGSAEGGGMSIGGQATITDSTFDRNVAQGGTGGIGNEGIGGAMYVVTNTPFSVSDCSFTRDEAVGGAGGAGDGQGMGGLGGAAYGGALANTESTLTVTSCSFIYDLAQGGDGGSGNPGGMGGDGQGGAIYTAAVLGSIITDASLTRLSDFT